MIIAIQCPECFAEDSIYTTEDGGVECRECGQSFGEFRRIGPVHPRGGAMKDKMVEFDGCVERTDFPTLGWVKVPDDAPEGKCHVVLTFPEHEPKPKMKPCPFCWGETELKGYESGWWEVVCDCVRGAFRPQE